MLGHEQCCKAASSVKLMLTGIRPPEISCQRQLELTGMLRRPFDQNADKTGSDFGYTSCSTTSSAARLRQGVRLMLTGI